VFAFPPQVFPDVMDGEVFVFAEALVEEFEKFLFGDGIGWVAIEEKFGIDFLLPRGDMTEFVVVFKDIKENIPDGGGTDSVKVD